MGYVFLMEVINMKINWNKGPFGIHSSDFEFCNRPSYRPFGYNYPPTLPTAYDKPQKREIPEDDKTMNKIESE